MKSQNIKRASTVLNLQKNIIGLKFVDLKSEFEASELQAPKKNGPLCYHLREALDGNIFKVADDNLTCEYAKYALGFDEPDKTILEGRSYEYCGLYESKGIARQIVSSMKYLDHEIYGIEVGPLELMDDSDIVIIIDFAETIMRVVQGYAYKLGTPDNLNFFGNQAACADLVSKPYDNNDINVSLMCRGMRANGRFEKGEMAAAFPINMFDTVVEGIVATVNPVSNQKEKKRILNELGSQDLGTELDMNYSYVMGLKEYDEKVRKTKKK